LPNQIGKGAKPEAAALRTYSKSGCWRVSTRNSPRSGTDHSNMQGAENCTLAAGKGWNTRRSRYVRVDRSYPDCPCRDAALPRLRATDELRSSKNGLRTRVRASRRKEIQEPSPRRGRPILAQRFSAGKSGSNTQVPEGRPLFRAGRRHSTLSAFCG
jgi:hypothetical protein